MVRWAWSPFDVGFVLGLIVGFIALSLGVTGLVAVALFAATMIVTIFVAVVLASWRVGRKVQASPSVGDDENGGLVSVLIPREIIVDLLSERGPRVPAQAPRQRESARRRSEVTTL